MICSGCGGILGRDCFNPRECEWIARQIEDSQYDDYVSRQYEEHLSEQYARYISEAEREYIDSFDKEKTL